MQNDTYSTRDTINNQLSIANCRGKKPVINVIKKAKTMLEDLLIEINPCEGKQTLKESIQALNKILKDNI